ncbi:helix-turn-helix domain-containing protein [Aeromonas veronii]|uniref:helix-turn-helix domain-containing protein n=1 Tax=Aeromonas veronii TaxID=654 RepID=UPI00106833CB|nr:hypothetical protein [Aeromonas veronii]
MNSAPVELGNQIGCLLPPNIQLVRFEQLKTTADVGGQIFELALVDHYAKRVLYYSQLIVLLNDPVLGAKPVTQLLVWRTPDPAYKSVISGVADRVFTDYLLENYLVAMSDNLQTGQGPQFWEQHILIALSHQLHVYCYQLMDTAPRYIPDKKSFEQLQDTVWKNTCDHDPILAIISKEPLATDLLHEMSITAIRNDADYEATLARIELLFDAPAGTPESDELNLLARLVEAYEEKHYPIAPPRAMYQEREQKALGKLAALAAEDIDQKGRSHSEDEAPPC